LGRKSKLTNAQWETIGKRFLAGEKPASLAKEYKIDRSAIIRKFSHQISVVKTVANQLLAADVALKGLPIAQQIQAVTLADDLRAISMHLAGAAKFGSATAHRLAGIANAKIEQIDDADPLGVESLEALKGVSALTRLANDASTIGVNLLQANKTTIEKINNEKPPEELEPLRPQISREEWVKLHT
jgi:hypothetical protein